MIKNLNVNSDQLLFYLYKTENLDLSGENPCRIRGFTKNNYDAVKEYAISEEYLNLRIENYSDGNIHYSYNKLIGETEGGKFLLDNLRSMLKFDSFYTSGYDPIGFVGWHTDSDISGHYISFVYQKDGPGVYRTFNYKTNSIQDYINLEGWSIFSHKLGHNKNDLVWHCAWSETPRYTFLIKFNTEQQQLDAIKLIEGK